MNRIDEILKYAPRDGFGLEIAPYFNPVAPKRGGFNVLVLDVFDTETLRERAKSTPLIERHRIPDIEPVDIVGSAVEIHDLLASSGHAGKLDYIISSHNFEHLPNPIKFLQGCYAALKPGAVLSMAVPDCRSCFDHFRYPTSLSDWLEAFFEDRKRPTPKQVFDGDFVRAYYHKNGGAEGTTGCSLKLDNPLFFKPLELIDDAYAAWKKKIDAPSGEYTDSHCSVFFNHTLELMLLDLQYLEIIEFEILEISESNFHEFYVHLKKSRAKPISKEAYYAKRQELLRKINQSLGWAGYGAWKNGKRQRYYHNGKPPSQRVAAEGKRVMRQVRRFFS